MIRPQDKSSQRLAKTETGARRRFGRFPKALTSLVAGAADTDPDPIVRDQLNPLRAYESLLPPGPDRVVVLLAHERVRTRLMPWLLPFGDDDVHVIAAESVPDWRLEALEVTYHAGRTLDEYSWQTRLIGAVDVLVNLLPGTISEHRTMWQRLFYYLKPGGAYVVDQGASEQGAFGPELSTWVRSISNADDPTVKPKPSARDQEFAASTESFAASRDLVVVKKQQRHYVKLRDTHASRLLALRDESVMVTELTRLPAGDVDTRAQITSHDSAVPITNLNERLHHPQLFLRHYEGRIGFAGSSLMFTDYTILPDSFRHHLQPNLVNPLMTNISVTFARVARDLLPKETLKGNYYQLDSSFSGHFGHLTTEVFAKLWGWDLAKQTIPDLKCLFAIKVPHQRDPALERRIFTSYGISEEDIVWVDRPVNLESVVCASPMWHNSDPHYVHPDMTKVWDRLGEALIDQSVPGHDRIFISRATKTERRTCRNVDEVEAFFTARGFAVIYPELLDLGEQAAIFAKASVIAGFGGSAMFNIMYAKNMKTLILLSHEAYTARNEHLFTALLGGDVHYFWSAPDIPHPEGGWTQDAFYSDWQFDFERNQKPLETLIASL